MTNLSAPEQTALADLRSAHPGWRIQRTYDGGPGWVAVHGPDADAVVRADSVEILGVRLHVAQFAPRYRSGAET